MVEERGGVLEDLDGVDDGAEGLEEEDLDLGRSEEGKGER